MSGKEAKERAKKLAREKKQKDKEAVIAFKKYYDLVKIGKTIATVKGDIFVQGTLAKIDGHYFYPYTGSNGKSIMIVREPKVENNIVSYDAGIAEGGFWPVGKDAHYLHSTIEEDYWIADFSDNGKLKKFSRVYGIGNGRLISKIYLGTTGSGIREKRILTLEEAVKKYDDKISAGLRRYLQSSMCGTIEDLVQAYKKKNNPGSR